MYEYVLVSSYFGSERTWHQPSLPRIAGSLECGKQEISGTRARERIHKGDKCLAFHVFLHRPRHLVPSSPFHTVLTTMDSNKYALPSSVDREVDVMTALPKTDTLPALSPSASEKESSWTEKAKDDALVTEEDVEDKQEAFTAEDLAKGIPFPRDSLPLEDGEGLTIRALVVGTALGFIIAASNIYLGLKTGFTFAACLFSSLLGFVICKVISRTCPERFLGGYFGPKENVTIQSAATGAGGLTSLFVAAVPAMYRLGLLGRSPEEDFGRLFTLCFCSAFYGCFFAVPLRKFYVLKQKLVFPTPTATALTIRTMHTANGAAIARKKSIALGIAFVSAVTYCVLNGFVPGILADQHIFYWLYTWGWTRALYVESWGWYTTITPAFFGEQTRRTCQPMSMKLRLTRHLYRLRYARRCKRQSFLPGWSVFRLRPCRSFTCSYW